MRTMAMLERSEQIVLNALNARTHLRAQTTHDEYYKAAKNDAEERPEEVQNLDGDALAYERQTPVALQTLVREEATTIEEAESNLQQLTALQQEASQPHAEAEERTNDVAQAKEQSAEVREMLLEEDCEDCEEALETTRCSTRSRKCRK